MHITVSPGPIVHKKLDFFKIVFLELCSVEISKLFQNPAILLIHYIQKNPGNYHTIKLYLFYENNQLMDCL